MYDEDKDRIIQIMPAGGWRMLEEYEGKLRYWDLAGWALMRRGDVLALSERKGMDLSPRLTRSMDLIHFWLWSDRQNSSPRKMLRSSSRNATDDYRHDAQGWKQN